MVYIQNMFHNLRTCGMTTPRYIWAVGTWGECQLVLFNLDRKLRSWPCTVASRVAQWLIYVVSIMVARILSASPAYLGEYPVQMYLNLRIKFCNHMTALLYHFDQLFGHRSQRPSKRRLRRFVTGHNGDRRDGQKFSVPAALLLLLTINSPKICSKRWTGCHTSSQVSKRCSSLRGGHMSQGAKSRSKWYSSMCYKFV